MDASDHSELRTKLADLAERIDQRSREFREHGEFSNVHDQTLNQVHDRYEQLESKVDEAVRGGSVWGLIRAQLVRDYNMLFYDFLRFEEYLDAEMMKEKKSQGW